MDHGYYGIVLLSVFLAISSFVIFFLFAGRASCMGKMLNGSELIASWQYSDIETIKNIKEMKEENKGLFVMAFPFFSLVMIIVAVTVGVASENIATGLFISLIVIIINILFFKFIMVIDIKEKEIKMTASNDNKRYVYISQSGIYAHGMLNVWKGWGSSLKSVHYDKTTQTLDFIYSYLRPYGFGRYTVNVKVQDDKLYVIDDLRNAFLTYWQE
jgi:hypothetical protein